MENREWTTIDKSEWGDGPWQNEPDKVQWIDQVTGLPCLIHRGPSGALCGYVGVFSSHAAYGLDYDNVDLGDYYPHGGLTFASRCNPEATDEDGICHVVEPGDDGDVWWFGFDCAHGGDVMPRIEGQLRKIREDGVEMPPLRFEGDTYKDIAYVTAEVAELASALAGES